MTEPVIEAAKVSMILGHGPARVRALKNINLALYGGKLTLLIGPSGSGKTTLLVDPRLHAGADRGLRTRLWQADQRSTTR